MLTFGKIQDSLIHIAEAIRGKIIYEMRFTFNGFGFMRMRHLYRRMNNEKLNFNIYNYHV